MTEPITPPDCDLRDFVWMPIDCNRLLTSETWVLGSADEKVASLTLWMKSWHQVPAGSLPDNDKMMAHMSEAGAKWSKVRDHALRGWVKCSDGRFYHPVVCEKAREAWANKCAQKARTEAARAAKAARRVGVSDGPQGHITTSVTDSVTGVATGSNRTDQNRTERKEEKDISVPDPSRAGAERAEPDAEPSWPPKPTPSSVATVVGQLAVKLERAAVAPAKPARTAAQQLAAVTPRRLRIIPADPEQLAQARADLARRAEQRP
jgi:hypothetical protein